MKHLIIPAFLVCCNIAAAQPSTPAPQPDMQKKAYMVSDAHLDTQWNWDVQTTIRHYIKSTLDQNLLLMRQYPNYIFNFEGGVKYAWMKEYYPLQYEELKKYVAKGQWHLTGSSWDACETIICSPESFLRNVLLGQTFYRQEFNTEGTDIFLPDCFGFPYTLPTLAAHCGLIGFSSQKLGWRTKPFFDDGRRYPFTVGLWQGIDGSRIMMTHGFGYGDRWPDSDLSHNERLLREASASPLGIVYRYYGTGDIGGSPTIPSVRAVEKGIKGDGPVKIISATSDQLYKDFLPYDRHPELPVYDGELTMDLHGNGCYTSQAAMKLYNRQNEHLGDAAERTAVMADWLGTAYPTQQMTDNWRRFIWHQFHDDVTGTSIPRAYEFSWNDELLTLKQFAGVMTHSVATIAKQIDTRVDGTPVVVYNNETFPIKAIAEVEATAIPQLTAGRACQVVAPDGSKVPSQVIERDGSRYVLFEADVPSTGFAVYSLKAASKANTAPASSGTTIENAAYRLTVDSHGDITSLFDKEANRELVASGRSLRLVVFDDCTSTAWPAWEIQKATIDRAPLPIHNDVTIATEQGPLRRTLVIRKRYGDSEIEQRIHLYEGSQARRIDFENTVDWRSLNALLKAEFPLSVSNPKATYDLGLGTIQRGNNCDTAFEVYAHEWTDLTDQRGDYGVTLLNDSRYGWDKPDDQTLRLSLLYSPKPAKSYAYQDRQDFGHHVFTYSLIGHNGPLDISMATRQATQLNSPLRTFVTTKHKGDLGRTFSFVASDNANVMVRALKKAEVSDEYVVRVYETSGKQRQQAHLTFAADIVSAAEADGTERTIGAATHEGRTLNITVDPYSLKTYKVKLAAPTTSAQPTSQVAMVNCQLPFDRQCASFNEFRSAANFEGGYSYAAELFPSDGITIDGVSFRLGEKEASNGLTCKGDTLQLPTLSTSRTAEGPRHLYLLAASDKGDREATFTIGQSRQTLEVPFYSGFVGQWGHDGHTTGFMKQARVAYVGTHRHSPDGDEPYEYTYMFLLRLDIPKGVSQVLLPDDRHVVIFAATLTSADGAITNTSLPPTGLVPAAPLFKTSLRTDDQAATEQADRPARVSVLKNATVVAVSGEVNEHERAIFLTDGRSDTKWCDSQAAPNYVVFDLGKPTTVDTWCLLNAGQESAAYITRTCLLQGRLNESDEWQTLDMFDGNRRNEVERHFSPTTVRYVRLFVVSPTQSTDPATRIYEFELF
ncbi:MAG: discoidin domain-containing protein [Prevotella sp.]|nr:discoidin domain-containing protein [Prevotella sp.]